jgi:hypothetical protein
MIFFDVRDSGITFKAVTQYIKSSADMHGSWAGISVERINYSEDRFQRPVGNTSLEVSGSDVQNRGACGFRPSSRGGRDYPRGQPNRQTK